MELERYKQWIKVKLSELIEGGALQEEPQPESGDFSSGLDPPQTTPSQTLKVGKPKASHSQQKQAAKQSNITKTPKIAKAFHASVEDESDEDGEDYGSKEKEKAVEDRPRSAKSLIYMNVSDVEDVEQMVVNDDASDAASEYTDDTFLPSDSISNVGTKNATPVLESQNSQSISPTPQPGQESGMRYNEKEKSSQSHDKSFQNKPRLSRKSNFPPESTTPRFNHSNDAKDFEPYINSDDRSGGGFQFSSPESIFSECLRSHGGSGESDDFEDFFPTSSRRNGQRARSRSRSKIPLRDQGVDESSSADNSNRENREPSSRLDSHHQARFHPTTAARRIPREYDEYYDGKPRVYYPEAQTYSWRISPEPPRPQTSSNSRSGRYVMTPSNDDGKNSFSFSNPDSVFAEFLREQPGQKRATTDKPDFHRPGLEKGPKIKISGLGDQVEGGRQDLHFIVEEKPHPLYRRDGNNLHHTVQLDLVESLCG